LNGSSQIVTRSWTCEKSIQAMNDPVKNSSTPMTSHDRRSVAM
jgi:hypothetical protein